ncbi:UPF0415 protein C7orf25 homolog isoform X2 [Lingula anatina]|nr:UPF0415 protein C7orf25 homolog isoform X2 [Lingula anatina]XP_023932079.1 UPF0415 protein C7orf25 homolog isoform X2 [Lingula anatina]|eukprot:XP_023932078.1 UPF0415 protein C7orf25 homolog isoform X2 [Lingula anatina]
MGYSDKKGRLDSEDMAEGNAYIKVKDNHKDMAMQKVKTSLLVDVVCEHGNKWVKVIARKAQALHLTWTGDGQFGDRNIVDQAADYIYYAEQNPVNYTPPRVLFVFHGGVTDRIAHELISVLGVEVQGEVVPADQYGDIEESEDEAIGDLSPSQHNVSTDAMVLCHTQRDVGTIGMSSCLSKHSAKTTIDGHLMQSHFEDKILDSGSESNQCMLPVTPDTLLQSECTLGTTNTSSSSTSVMPCIEGCLACQNCKGFVNSPLFDCTCIVCKDFFEKQLVFSSQVDKASLSTGHDCAHNAESHLSQSQPTHCVKTDCDTSQSTREYEHNSVSHLTQSDTVSQLKHWSSQSTDTIRRVNLDVTAMIALISALTHGGSGWVFKEAVLTAQAEEERQAPALPQIYQFIFGKSLYACQSAVKDFQSIVSLLGGPAETRRAEQLLGHIHVVPDCPPSHVVLIKCTGSIKERAKVIFGSGETLRALTLSANMGFIRAADNQGVTFAVLVHASRALTEQKQKTGTPLNSG